MFASEGCVDQPFDEPIGRLAHQHASRLGECLQTGGDVDRVAQDGQAILSAALELPKNCRARADPDANLRSNAIFGVDVGPNGWQALQNRQRRPACAQRCVFACDRRAENDHHAVAEDVLNSSTLELNNAFDELR